MLTVAIKSSKLSRIQAYRASLASVYWMFLHTRWRDAIKKVNICNYASTPTLNCISTIVDTGVCAAESEFLSEEDTPPDEDFVPAGTLCYCAVPSELSNNKYR